ncbi:MAG: hypothetical protein AAF361_14910 [Bacteroidota bacterium]
MKAIEDWRAYMNTLGTPERAFRRYHGIVHDSIRYLVFFHKLTSTSIWFYLPKEDYNRILCAYYINSNTRGWSGELRNVNFDQKGIWMLDDFLRPAMETGWESIDYYLMGKYFTSCVKAGEDGSGKVIQKFTSYYKFWSYLMFPICFLMDQMMQYGLIGRSERISLQPIRTKTK